MSKIGELLIKQGLLNQAQMASAIEDQKKTGNRFVDTIISLGFIKESQILQFLKAHYKLPGIDLHTFPIQKSATELVKRDFCERHALIPVQTVGDQGLLVAFAEPGNIQVIDDIRFLTRKKIQAVVATESAVFAAIDRYMNTDFKSMGKDTAEPQDDSSAIGEALGNNTIEGNPEDGPIIKFVNSMMAEAIRKKASDIHFEPYEKKFRVRFRVDGNMMEVQEQPISVAPAIASRIKIMSRLDIAEKRRPQDGRIKIQYKGGKDMDFRVSVMPTIYGEKIVLRLLDKSNLQLDMTKLGFEPEDLVIFRDARLKECF